MVTCNVPGQLNLTIDGIKATFFEYPYEVINPFIEHEGVNLLTVQEIASTKALSIGKRLSFKDYVDWYFMLSKGHVKLSEVIELSQRKFGADFNDRLFLGQLASIDDIQEQPIGFLVAPVSHQAIKEFLVDTVRKFKL